MSGAVKVMALVPVDEQQALTETPGSMFERLARDPQVDVDKLERLMQLHERMKAQAAKEQFNVAMSVAQQTMRPIAADAANPQTHSKYASYAALDKALRPIYTEHGFALSFDTGEPPREDMVRMLCYVSHSAGHERTYHADMPADGKGAKGGDVMTKTHATGAAMSYGMRYLLKMIFNVAVGEDDVDGNTVKDIPPPPAGFQKWWEGLELVVPEGLERYHAVWTAGTKAYREYAVAHLRGKHEAFKVRARAAGGGRKIG